MSSEEPTVNCTSVSQENFPAHEEEAQRLKQMGEDILQFVIVTQSSEEFATKYFHFHAKGPAG